MESHPASLHPRPVLREVDVRRIVLAEAAALSAKRNAPVSVTSI
jgi:hypothetical protein